MARIPRANHATSPQYIYERKEFTCNSMSGRWVEPWNGHDGELNDEEAATYAMYRREGNTFVVYSYSTPIAFWNETYGWHKVDQKFSPTTSKHQSRLYLI